MELLKLSNQLCFPLYALSRKITSHYLPLLEKIGLTYPQYLVMMVLWEEDSVSVKELGHKLMLDSGTLSPLLKKLEDRELVIRKRLKEDERVVIITLTESGEQLKESASLIPEQIKCSLELTDKEMREMKTLATGLLEKINQIEKVHSN
ncbi:MarR family winged helix-turn-helix transcriptional regulator [Dyadobacter frigoris]|uniref:HTH-type transcriptional regulator SarZ n=1 Tax=Dyadobacter frigoris TaxID=2576211 RepID=A0A4U6CV04_9BACT|nr:MarR family transcriptional regulator [Dyadobacter frigoris]TKT88569.1 MarR family transcriptional regulator [Dyadobacter frigoris]GLU54619.1 MarR family transcriptional regulator [Dyadobacter frigoris]